MEFGYDIKLRIWSSRMDASEIPAKKIPSCESSTSVLLFFVCKQELELQIN